MTGNVLSTRTARALALVASLIIVSGCSVYLHDDNVQRQTADALATYTSADIPAAISAIIASQTVLDDEHVNAVAGQEEAEREKDLILLLAGTDGASSGPPASRIPMDQGLRSRLDARISALAGAHFAGWDLAHQVQLSIAVAKAKAQLQQATDNVNALAARYSGAGGKDFASCTFFKASATDPPALLQSAVSLQEACVVQENTRSGLQALLGLLTQPVCSGGGELQAVCTRVAAQQKQIQSDKAAAAQLATELAAAKASYEKATQDSTGIDAKVTAALAKLNADLDKADQVVGAVGTTGYQPGAALTAIQFRKTNICDVIAASAKTNCSGTGAPTQSATSVETAMVGVIAGAADLSDPLSSSSPAALQIALAYQTGLQSSAQASLTGVTNATSLLQSEESTMAHELTLLVRAKSELQAYEAEEQADGCATKSGWRRVGRRSPVGSRTATKADERRRCVVSDDLDTALLDYNLSWIEGRIPEQIDQIKLDQGSRATDLQVTEANTVAWDGTLKAALTQLSAFGQGGVAPQTIATFLEVAGIGAIAKGVN